MDGKKIKALNQWYNKENSRLQSIKNRQGIPGITERQARLILKCNNRVRDYLNQVARYIINYCQTHQIGKLIVGYNPTVKQEIKIGSRNNQNFVQIPHYSLKAKLKALCFRYGIRYLEEESYTSQASFLDGDDIPSYNANNPKEYTFSGKRVKRSLYRSRNGHLINADVQGAANILFKSSQKLNFGRLASGLLANPLRVCIS